jgi:hypothetical protein
LPRPGYGVSDAFLQDRPQLGNGEWGRNPTPLPFGSSLQRTYPESYLRYLQRGEESSGNTFHRLSTALPQRTVPGGSLYDQLQQFEENNYYGHETLLGNRMHRPGPNPNHMFQDTAMDELDEIDVNWMMWAQDEMLNRSMGPAARAPADPANRRLLEEEDPRGNGYGPNLRATMIRDVGIMIEGDGSFDMREIVQVEAEVENNGLTKVVLLVRGEPGHR